MVEMEGFDEIQQELEDMQKRAQELDGENQVKLKDVFPPGFIRQHSGFSNIDELLEESPLDIDLGEGENLEDHITDEFNQFVAENTSFEGYGDMKSEASTEWFAKEVFGS
jgi:hypothetical protein